MLHKTVKLSSIYVYLPTPPSHPRVILSWTVTTRSFGRPLTSDTTQRAYDMYRPTYSKKVKAFQKAKLLVSRHSPHTRRQILVYFCHSAREPNNARNQHQRVLFALRIYLNVRPLRILWSWFMMCHIKHWLPWYVRTLTKRPALIEPPMCMNSRSAIKCIARGSALLENIATDIPTLFRRMSHLPQEFGSKSLNKTRVLYALGLRWVTVWLFQGNFDSQQYQIVFLRDTSSMRPLRSTTNTNDNIQLSWLS